MNFFLRRKKMLSEDAQQCWTQPSTMSIDLAISAINTFHTTREACGNNRFSLLDIVCDNTTTSEDKVNMLRRCILNFRNTKIDPDPKNLPEETKSAINQATAFLALGKESDQASVAGLMAERTTKLMHAHNELLNSIKNIVCNPETTSDEKIYHVENVLM